MKTLHWKLSLCPIRSVTAGPKVGPRICGCFFHTSLLQSRSVFRLGWRLVTLKIFIWLKPTYQCIYQTEAQLWNNMMKSRCKEKTFVPVEAPPLNSATLCSVCPSVKFKINHRICWAAKSMAYNTRQTLWELWQEKIRGWKIKKNLKETKSWGWYY